MEVRIDGRAAGARFSACHLIPGHDKCGRLHGHSYSVSCRFHGDVRDGEDMLLDFISVKGALRAICDELDHLVLVPTQGPDIAVEEREEEISFSVGGKRYVLPREDVKLLPMRVATAERLAEWFLSELASRLELPSSVKVIEVGVEEELGQSAWARWSL